MTVNSVNAEGQRGKCSRRAVMLSAAAAGSALLLPDLGMGSALPSSVSTKIPRAIAFSEHFRSAPEHTLQAIKTYARAADLVIAAVSGQRPPDFKENLRRVAAQAAYNSGSYVLIVMSSDSDTRSPQFIGPAGMMAPNVRTSQTITWQSPFGAIMALTGDKTVQSTTYSNADIYVVCRGGNGEKFASEHHHRGAYVVELNLDNRTSSKIYAPSGKVLTQSAAGLMQAITAKLYFGNSRKAFAGV